MLDNFTTDLFYILGIVTVHDCRKDQLAQSAPTESAPVERSQVTAMNVYVQARLSLEFRVDEPAGIARANLIADLAESR